MIDRVVDNEVNLVLTDGGMGDLVCELVAVDYNIRNFVRSRFHVWTPDYLTDFARHVLSPGAFVRPFSEAKEKFNQAYEGRTTEWCTHHTCMRTHPVDYGFHMLSDRHIYDLNEKNYLQIKPEKIDVSRLELPKDYVCIVAAAAEPVKEMPLETFNKVADWVHSNGYTPVYIGRQESKAGIGDHAIRASTYPLPSYGVNLLNKTNMLEVAAVMSGAKAVVGMDGGLIHVAGCTDVPIICGYTLVDPIHVAPIRRGSTTFNFKAVEPDTGIKNRYYQTYGSGFHRGDFRKFEGWEQVVASMTADKFINALEEIL